VILDGLDSRFRGNDVFGDSCEFFRNRLYAGAVMDVLPFSTNRLLQGMLLWLLLLWVITAIDPFNRRDWLLENLLVFLYGFLLVVTYRRFAFSNLSYGLFTVFLSLHLVGAHYTYAETPFGFWLQDLFALERNHYDRIVHFSFGLLIAYPFRELLLRATGVRVSWSYLLTVAVVLAFSNFYEIIEAIVAEIVSPDLGSAYLGTQGDIWDAQKDAFVAFLGSVLAMTITWLRVRVAPYPPTGERR
jgi:putative membrane protein